MITIHKLRVLNIFNVLIILSNCIIIWIVTRLFVADISMLLPKDQMVKLHVLKVVYPGKIYLCQSSRGVVANAQDSERAG